MGSSNVTCIAHSLLLQGHVMMCMWTWRLLDIQSNNCCLALHAVRCHGTHGGNTAWQRLIKTSMIVVSVAMCRARLVRSFLNCWMWLCKELRYRYLWTSAVYYARLQGSQNEQRMPSTRSYVAWVYLELQVALQVIFANCNHSAAFDTARLSLCIAVLRPLVADVSMLTYLM